MWLCQISLWDKSLVWPIVLEGRAAVPSVSFVIATNSTGVGKCCQSAHTREKSASIFFVKPALFGNTWYCILCSMFFMVLSCIFAVFLCLFFMSSFLCICSVRLLIMFLLSNCAGSHFALLFPFLAAVTSPSPTGAVAGKAGRRGGRGKSRKKTFLKSWSERRQPCQFFDLLFGF